MPSTLSAIRAAAAANREPYEIIVVERWLDRCDSDGGGDGRRSSSSQIHRRQIAAARNAGAREARGDILFFVDADTRISSAHVTGARAALAAGCAGGSARGTLDGVVPLWGRVFVHVFSAFYFTVANLGAGAFLFTTRENFEAVGGFDKELFAGEEIYFSQALKKLGRFRVLAEPVVTSGRKLRMYSARQILGLSVGIVLRGKQGVRSRDKLDLWYDGKRETKTRDAVSGSAPE